jgi:hypothetical protein
MTVKQKLTKEINKMPESALEQFYSYLQFFKKSKKRRHIIKFSEDKEWLQYTMQEFLKGYSKGDEIYDKL